MNDSQALMALIVYKNDDMSDEPLMVIVSKTGLTHKVIRGLKDQNARASYDNYKYNGIVEYHITVSEKEYERFETIADHQEIARGKI
jgi:hypothetical protein